jgi:hypothetical protein
MKLLVDPQDAHILEDVKWSAAVGGKYHIGRVGGRVVYLHRLLVGAAKGQLVDHINGNTWDNRRANLRVCNRSESNSNRRAKRTSNAPFKGITLTKSGRWLAQIMKNKTYHRIGLFDSAEDAAAAYDRKAGELHGQFARTNGLGDLAA